MRELLGEHFELEFVPGTSFFRPQSGEAAWDTFSRGFGPVVSLLQTLGPPEAAALKADFIAFHEAHRSGAGILMRRPYVITKARRLRDSERAS